MLVEPEERLAGPDPLAPLLDLSEDRQRGRSDAVTDGLTQRIVTSRVGSDARTVAMTLMS